jgi:DtxR family Mn-dependent transcriptional regulator
MVAEEITESICILLGHPRSCPHGSPIPKGSCCEAVARACEAAVVPLTEVALGAAARIAYVNGASDERHHRLTHFGVVPGATIRLHQLRPAVVVMLDNVRLAMEPCIAREIFVWKKSPAVDGAAGSPPAERQKKWYDGQQERAEPKTRGRRLLRFWRR